MKTKIIYISGNEVFDMNDIRAAFDEVRKALNLDKNTVLFGVPVDEDDAGLAKVEQNLEPEIIQEIIGNESIAQTESVSDIETEPSPEPVIEAPIKKRSYSKKNKATDESQSIKSSEINIEKNDEEKIVPILSVLSSKETVVSDEEITEDIVKENSKIIENVTDETPELAEIIDEHIESVENVEDIEPDLEKLLSAMKPLQEDILENKPTIEESIDSKESETDNIDETLKQLADEFVQTQDKIAAESKSSGRGKIGKLRNILPFKPSKHKDQGLGDLFGWAGVAANDEDFSVPGFFTNAASKK
jgi:DNA repair exonuclease SbcCD ATPase subunit